LRESPIEKNRRVFFRLILIFGMVGSVSLPVINILLKVENSSVAIDIVAFFAFAVIYFLFTKKHFEAISYWLITVLSFLAIIGINFQSPDFFNVRNVSLFAIFPIISVFLLGKKNGLLLSLIFLFNVFVFTFVITEIGTAFLISFDIAIALFVLYFYQHSQEKTQEELASTIAQITHQKEQLERMNKVMVDREIIMIELKKKIEMLENKA
jgi:hypothetical protein